MFRVAATISLVGGTLFLMWIGEQITSRGIGNGVSLIIMAGIVASLPVTLAQIFEGGRTGTMDPLLVAAIVALAVGLVLFICFVERAQRRVPIQYPKRQTARGVMQQERSHLPLKLNTAGVIPPIFASSLLLMPLTVLQFAGGNAANPDSTSGDWLITISTYLQHGAPLYLALYAAGIAFFCFFYTAVQFNSEETAENLKRHGGFIPGIRPGKRTAEYIDTILARLTLVGALYLACVALLPEFLLTGFRVAPIPFIGEQLDAILPTWFTQGAGVTFYFGGTSLLIVVGVAMDTVNQVESQLIMRHYDGFMKKTRIRGRRG